MILTEIDDRVAFVTLNRPEKRNALGPELVQQLTSAIERFNSDPDIRVIVLRAVGKAFSAGADLDHLHQLTAYTEAENRTDTDLLKALYSTLFRSPKVVIAQVEGIALAGGCGLLTVCDFVFSVPHAQLGYPEVKIGFLPALVAYFLCRRIGESRARELLLTGKMVSADQALHDGLIHFISPADRIEADVSAFAADLCRQTSGTSIAATKELLLRVADGTMEEILDRAAEANVASRFTVDFKKGMAAFLSKTPLSW